jgi:hypothetical protein
MIKLYYFKNFRYGNPRYLGIVTSRVTKSREILKKLVLFPEHYGYDDCETLKR